MERVTSAIFYQTGICFMIFCHVTVKVFISEFSSRYGRKLALHISLLRLSVTCGL